jgi:hypothetical protein
MQPRKVLELEVVCATAPPTIAKLEGGLNCLNCTRIAGSATTCSTNREDIARKVSE